MWALSLPDWVDVRVTVVNDAGMLHLDPGERAAITLAQRSLAPSDDAAGTALRHHGEAFGYWNIGVLRAAAVKELVDLPIAPFANTSKRLNVGETRISAIERGVRYDGLARRACFVRIFRNLTNRQFARVLESESAVSCASLATSWRAISVRTAEVHPEHRDLRSTGLRKSDR